MAYNYIYQITTDAIPKTINANLEINIDNIY